MPSRAWARKSMGMALQSAGRGQITRLSNPVSRTMAINQYMLDATLGRPLPRPMDLFENGFFTPNRPSDTYPIDLQRGNQAGGPDPRIWQYPIGWNLPSGPRTYEPVSFDALRQVSRQVDAVRTSIQILKDEVFNADWSIKVRDPNLARKEGRDFKKDEKKRIEAFFRHPDPVRGLPFLMWGKLIIEEILATDALSIYPRRSLNGDLVALQVLDGATIKPLLDLQGGRPLPPAPAYQQYLYGVPRSEFAAHGVPEMTPFQFDESVPRGRNLSTQQLMYLPLVQAANTVYGLPPTESVLQTAVTYLRRMGWWQNYFVDGDVPAAFVMGGEGWTPEQLERWEAALHSLMAGDPSFRHRLKAVPYGTNVKEMKQPNFDVGFDEFLLKVVAMVFRVTSNELFGMSSSSGLGGKGFLEEQMDVGERKAVQPLRNTFEMICDQIIMTEFHEEDLCFKFDDLDMVDRLKQAQIDDVNLKNGSSFIEEVRETRGQGSLDMPEALVPHIETRAGLTALDKIDEFNELLLQQGAAGQGGVSTGSDSAIKKPNAAAGDTTPGSHPGPREGSPSAAKAVELEQFVKFLKSSQGGKRPFNFKVLSPELREPLERLAMDWASE